MVDIYLAVQRRRSNAQSLGTARYGRVIDRLHVDAELFEQLVADISAQHRVADHDRHDVAGVVEVRDTRRIKAAAHQCDALVQLPAFRGAFLQVTDAGPRGRSYSGRQRRREDETGGKAAYEIAQRHRARDISADHPERFRQGAFNHRQLLTMAVTLGNATAAWTVQPDRMHLVEISHRTMRGGDIAKLSDRRDVAIHRIDR